MELNVSKITGEFVQAITFEGDCFVVSKGTQVYHCRGNIFVVGMGVIKSLQVKRNDLPSKYTEGGSAITFKRIKDIQQVHPSIIKYHKKLNEVIVKGVDNTPLQHALDSQNSTRMQQRDDIATMYIENRLSYLYSRSGDEFKANCDQITQEAYILADAMLKNRGL